MWGPETIETRRCPHGKRADDWCRACLIDEVMAMRRAGKSYEIIAKAVGYSPSTVHRWVQTAYMEPDEEFVWSPETKANIESRFWVKVEVGSEDECWPWLGVALKEQSGTRRGTFWAAGKMRVAPAVALVLSGSVRPSPRHFACHSCDNPICVNPAHLWWGTARDNAIDASRKGRLAGQKKTHCKRGHPLSGENVFTTAHGTRSCRICQRMHHRTYQQKPESKAVKIERQRIRREAARAALSQEEKT